MSGSTQPSSAPFYQSVGTKKMAALLAETFAKTDWHIDPNKADQQAAYYKNLLATHKLRPADQVLVGSEMAQQQLRAGDSAGSVATLEGMLANSELKDAIHAPSFDTKIHLSLAMAYLRLGEQENCAAMHGQKSCNFRFTVQAFISCHAGLKAQSANFLSCSKRIRMTSKRAGS